VRPMVRLELEAGGMGHQELESRIRSSLEDLPEDSVVNLRIRGTLTKQSMEMLRAQSMRELAPPTMNVSLSLADQVTVPSSCPCRLTSRPQTR